MNATQFFTAQLEAEQRFRQAMEDFEKKFEVNNAPNPNQTPIPQDNSGGQLNNSPQPNDLPAGNVLPAAPQ